MHKRSRTTRTLTHEAVGDRMIAFMGAVMGIGIIVVGVLVAAFAGLMAGIIYGVTTLAVTGV